MHNRQTVEVQHVLHTNCLPVFAKQQETVAFGNSGVRGAYVFAVGLEQRAGKQEDWARRTGALFRINHSTERAFGLSLHSFQESDNIASVVPACVQVSVVDYNVITRRSLGGQIVQNCDVTAASGGGHLVVKIGPGVCGIVCAGVKAERVGRLNHRVI